MRVVVAGAGGIDFVAEVRSGLERTCQRILTALAHEPPRSVVPERRARDWYLVELHRSANEVLVLEPDYLGGSTDYRASLNVTSAICEAQARLHEAASAPRAAISHEQAIAFEPDALEDEVILATRSEPTQSNDSGWRIIRGATRSPPPRWDALRLHTLVTRRPIAVVGLQLPADWSFKVVGQTIDEIATPDGGKVRVGIELDLKP